METLYLTGSSGALAQAVRDRYLAEGWNVAGFSRSADGLRHSRFRFFEMDATSEPSVERTFGEANVVFGPPRALIATVGGIRPWQTVEQTTIEDFRYLVDLNLTSLFLASKHAMRLMQEKGTIVSIGAEPALTPTAKRGAYAASKAGALTLTRVLAEEGKSKRITANAIVPTVIHTKENEEWGSADEIPKWTEPKDIAALCFFLTRAEGAAVNGAIIRIPNKL
ncbi:MAG: SDR family oxidoreductase [Bacteroidota bacterium]|nr:SDR family oxidoreductase [Bacteroidota bacterium]